MKPVTDNSFSRGDTIYFKRENRYGLGTSGYAFVNRSSPDGLTVTILEIVSQTSLHPFKENEIIFLEYIPNAKITDHAMKVSLNYFESNIKKKILQLLF